MDQEHIKKIIDDPEQYNQSNENSLSVIIKDFYNHRMLSIVILVWSMGIVIIAGAIFSGIEFFKTDDIKSQIMFAVIFMTLINWVGLLKVFAWLMIHRNGLKREIKRLELRIAELSETIKER